MNNALTNAQRRTLKLQLTMRLDERATCKTAAQVAAVQSEIDRIESILRAGHWPE